MKYSLILLLCFAFIGCSRPTKQYNQSASLNDADSLPFNPLNDAVLSSFVNPVQHTMSTLYGNTLAIQHARTVGNVSYPAGSILALVTWKQQPDPRWFGGNIPDRILSVEVVQIDPVKPNTPVYRLYEGNPLRLQHTTKNTQSRIRLMMNETVSFIP